MGRGEAPALDLPRLRAWDLVPLLLTVGLAGAFFLYGLGQMEGRTLVEIQTPAGQFVYPLGIDRALPARGPLGDSLIRIQGRQAWFESSPCQNQLCVQMGHLHAPGQWAACLPNRIFLRLTARREDIDALSQ